MTNRDTTGTSREAFERKYAELYPVACMASNKFKREDFGDGEYEDICVQVAWTMYQALSQPPQPAQEREARTPDALLPHLRQYMHNDGSGFVAGYDKEGIDRLFASLSQPAAPEGAEQRQDEGRWWEVEGIPKEAMYAANALLADMIGKPEWDRPCAAKHLMAYTASPSSSDTAEKDAKQIEILRHERDHARACLDRAVKILSSIHMRIYPQLHTHDGVTYHFKAPDPHLYLQGLADCIRAIPGEIDALRSKEASTADAEDARRYRWIAAQAKREGRDGGWWGYYGFPLIDGWNDTPYAIRRGEGFHHKTVDEAIDAAMSAKERGE